MKLTKATIRGLAQAICGNSGTSDKYCWDNFIYRSSSDLTDFFGDCELDYIHDGSTREDWVIKVLTELNETTASDLSLPADKIIKVIEELLNSVEMQFPNKHINAVNDIKRILKFSGLVILFKQGEYKFMSQDNSKRFWEELINQTLEGVEDYPEIAKLFEKALNDYQVRESNQYRNVLDDLRLTIEQLLKKVLSNEKSLENQKNELGTWLEDQGLPKELRNFFTNTLFNYYTKFQNDYVKHQNEAIDFLEEEVEFNIYLTGILIRFFTRLDQNTE